MLLVFIDQLLHSICRSMTIFVICLDIDQNCVVKLLILSVTFRERKCMRPYIHNLVHFLLCYLSLCITERSRPKLLVLSGYLFIFIIGY